MARIKIYFSGREDVFIFEGTREYVKTLVDKITSNTDGNTYFKFPYGGTTLMVNSAQVAAIEYYEDKEEDE